MSCNRSFPMNNPNTILVQFQNAAYILLILCFLFMKTTRMKTHRFNILDASRKWRPLKRRKVSGKPKSRKLTLAAFAAANRSVVRVTTSEHVQSQDFNRGVENACRRQVVAAFESGHKTHLSNVYHLDRGVLQYRFVSRKYKRTN